MTRTTVDHPDLLPRIAAGEQGVADELLERYGGLVWALARRALLSSADVEDAVQDIFVELWRVADRFDPSVASEATFVAMITRRRLIDRQRKSARRPRFVDHEAIERSSRFSMQRERATEDDVQTALNALEACSQPQQDVLRLSLLEGMPQEKIARVLDMPLGTVKTHSRRGLMRLRDALMGDTSTESEAAS